MSTAPFASPSSPAAAFAGQARGARPRRPSFTESYMNSRAPLGALAATGDAIGSAPSLADLRRHSVERRRSSGAARRASSVSALGTSASPPIAERRSEDTRGVGGLVVVAAVEGGGVQLGEGVEKRNGVGNGEVESGDDDDDEKPGWWAVTVSGLKAFWKFFKTWTGFFVTIYMLNVIAWGGMLFLLLCNASPAMCHPTCNDLQSPRRIWIEITSQILNTLFCLTGFGLIPWRFRDLFHLLNWRLKGNKMGYIKLQEINQDWYRPKASTASAAAQDEEGAAQDGEEEEEETLTGQHAPPTGSWKLDYVIWLYVWNTFFQACLSGFMWGMNRYDRPSWSTGLFVALSFIVAGLAGGQVWWETRKVKKIEGDRKKEEKKKALKEEKREKEKARARAE
ncbi:hypothetical protein BZA05DRAFT_429929 [Tricharina praecox]|uniref:uncharacterized protein n=1 Tax=Tricharina praecox TaxID=43433 RepID=UPI002220DB88|nr:uncharacterized protein BZA05DRAFT_429929 [Tricharina praecox]KAI5853432.1 hypothetical protein BZA05DRAFT_429929 [Tricharina praecox]